MRLASLPLAALLLGACGSAPPAAPRASVPKAAPTHDVEAPARPRLPKEEVAVSFDRGLWRLEGTLTLPAREEGERVPAVVIVHGSGPMSRDGVMRGQIGLGFGFQIPVYQRLADALADRGYAVYRYDKRTCGAFNDCSDGGFTSVPYTLLEVEFATTEYVLDAEAALDAVAGRPEIDPDRLVFAGHSEGGELVPVLLSDRPRVRAGVMLAPPFHTMTVVLEQQAERVRWSFTMAGQPERAEAEGRELLAAAQALRQIERGTHLGAPILGQPPGLWESWIDLARRAPDLARKLDRPLLVLGGSYDYNVAPSEIESWAKWLDGSSRAPHRVRVIDCVTHALNCITQPDATRIKPDDIGRDISPEVLTEVSRFLDAHASRAKLTEARR
ncbi:alpha/beta fold hydrolase [Polyangium sp. y55x31]|uniref:alpha/beta hydrolase family protein n=1 Tax=Polyangium sp. y55x31 TaxID=3042688 RepID=UPI002482B001|nr:alpha/beta fold hydrolase [Polyangium sp. y55x31]MDI1479540.1 alpha/beta fold hydrolase [Polyangium sp. y55x31]